MQSITFFFVFVITFGLGSHTQQTLSIPHHHHSQNQHDPLCNTLCLLSRFFFSFPPLPVDKGQEKTTYREGLVDDNTVGDQGTEEGTRVPVGTGLGVESSPVRDVESCADEHREMAQPPNELGTLLIHGRAR